MNAKVKEIVERHEKDLGDENCTNANFEHMIRDAVKEDVLEDLLDVLNTVGLDVPVKVVTMCLCEHYVSNWNSLTREVRENKVRNITNAINKNQINIFKAMN